MEYLLGLVVIMLLFWVFSTKKQMTAVRSFSAIDAAKPWFQENDLDAGKAKFSSYVNGAETTLVGVTTNSQSKPIGFAVSVDHAIGIVTDKAILSPATALSHKHAAQQSKEIGLPIVTLLRQQEIAKSA